MAKRSYAAKTCARCTKSFSPTGPRATVCEDCRGEPASTGEAHADGNGQAPAIEALDVIDAFNLDFNTGNAIRFLLEKSDGDELTNLQTARVYLDRAIARLERNQLQLSL